MPRRPFPFPPLPPGQVTPEPGPGDDWDLLARDVAIVRWFIEEWWGSVSPDAPLSRMLAAYDTADPRSPLKRIEESNKEDRQHGLYLNVHFMRLAWAIRALHGREDACKWVDASFVGDELLGEDSKEKNPGLRKVPGGIGTLVLAGRLVQAGGGHVCVSGRKKKGHDIRWRTADGDTVLIERKDRSYDAGQRDTLVVRVGRVVLEVKSAKFPVESGVTRILSVGFSHLVPDHDAAVVDLAYQRALEAERRNLPPESPHFVLVEHLGLDPRPEGEGINFFSPQHLVDLTPGPLERVARLLLRACGQPV